MPSKSAKRVFALFVPGIHVILSQPGKDVDGRDKPGHDEANVCTHESNSPSPEAKKPAKL
jgi:hypothetical protein